MTQTSTVQKVTAYIGLGSNLDHPLTHIKQAAEALNRIPHTRLLALSPLYQSKAIGPGEQSDYINAAAALETSLPPLKLLHQLQIIESQQGRKRGPVRWVARTLDLDLLLFDNVTLETEELTIPHPRMTERNFVLFPLRDLAKLLSPSLALPDGRPIADLAQSCNDSGISLTNGQ
ncbi:MAG: 2-amino-4-hydroxy-6-hydroxymethyldihydropteridine diphosphokinase [Pseudomonadales bacterium]|nr:2-amino-4-hydroxy-6-hydroxymethyldihydropteridine diphosphokinase [Pseudomonadales bacterium]